MKEGWKCPVCNNVYAPFVRECEKCNNKVDRLSIFHTHSKSDLGYTTSSNPDSDEVHYICKFDENDNVPDSDVMFKKESPEELRKAGDA